VIIISFHQHHMLFQTFFYFFSSLNRKPHSFGGNHLQKQLNVLREAGLIRSERVGVEMHNTSRCAEVEERFPGLLQPIVNAYTLQLKQLKAEKTKAKVRVRK